MADQIGLSSAMVLLFDGGDGTGGQPDGLDGVATGSTDTSTFLEGSTSYTYSATNSREGFLYDAGSAQDFSDNTFYMTMNVGVVGLLLTYANGGVRMRFCGATVTDFFEVDLGGSDLWPISIQGGWVTFVVDIETAKLDAGRTTGGSEPATNAIRYVGFSLELTIMPKMADNVWFDTLYRLPDGNPGIVIEGRNGGSVDWNAADILTELGNGQMFYYQGPAGSYVLTTPIQFGINDSSTHGFEDTNAIWAWDDQEFVPDDLYSLSALGNSGGTTRVLMGEKAGSGVNSSGSQGFTIVSSGPRWNMDFDDPDLDDIGFYGCSFQKGGDFQLDDAAVEAVSTLFIDVGTVEASGSDLFIKNSYITSAALNNAAALRWNENQDPDGELDASIFTHRGDIESPSEFHHAIAFGSGAPAVITLRGQDFSGFSSADDEDGSVFVFESGESPTDIYTLNLVGCSHDGSGFTVDARNGAIVNVVIDPVSTTVTIIDENSADLQNVRVYLAAADGSGDLPFEDTVTITRSGTLATVAHTGHGLATGNDVKIKGITDKTEDNNGTHQITVVDADEYTYTTTDSGSTSYTGTITSTGVVFNDLTDVNGEVTESRTWSADQPITGFARLSTTTPRYKTFPITTTIDSENGLSLNIMLARDE